MQMKTSLNTLALAALVVTSVPAQGLYNPLTSQMGTTLKNHCTWQHAILFAIVASLYRFNDRKPTKDPSRADWAKLDAELDGKNIKEQLLLISHVRHLWRLISLITSPFFSLHIYLLFYILIHKEFSLL